MDHEQDAIADRRSNSDEAMLGFESQRLQDLPEFFPRIFAWERSARDPDAMGRWLFLRGGLGGGELAADFG